MHLLEQARAWLTAINPELPWALLALAVFAICYAVRRWLPRVWERIVAIVPVRVDTSGALVALRKLWQSWPSALLGAVLPVLLTGGDTKLAAKGALVGLLAPLIHELAKWAPFLPYRGATKPKSKDDDKTPTDGKPVHVHFPLPLLVLALGLLLTGCGLLGGAASPEAPPCDEVSYAKLSVECGDDEAKCDAALSEREAFCAKQIQGEP